MPVMYCVALAVGSVVGAVILSLLKKTPTEDDQAILPFSSINS